MISGLHSKYPLVANTIYLCYCIDRCPTSRVRLSVLCVTKVMRACMLTSSRRAAGDSNSPLRRPNTLGSSAIMTVRGALLLAMAVQSRGFLVAPSARVRLGTSRPRASTSTTVMAYDVRYSPNRWKDDEGDIEPGFGGIWPGDPDAKTHKARTCNPTAAFSLQVCLTGTCSCIVPPNPTTRRNFQFSARCSRGW